MASTLRLNPAIAREASAQKQQMVLEQRQRTQMNIAQQQQQFAAWQQMHASQQAAFDSYQQAWFDRSDRQHAANMAASAANFPARAWGRAPPRIPMPFAGSTITPDPTAPMSRSR